MSLSPASSVLRRTLARTGRVLLVETARLTTDRPRARFSCMTESFTVFSVSRAGRADRRRGGRRAVCGIVLLSIYPSSSSSCCGAGGRCRSVPCGRSVDSRSGDVDEASRDGGLPSRLSVDSRADARRRPAPDGTPNTRSEVGDVHNGVRFSTESSGLSTRGGSLRPFRATPASVGVDQLPDRGDLASQLIVVGRLAGDLVARVEHRGVVPAARARRRSGGAKRRSPRA